MLHLTQVPLGAAHRASPCYSTIMTQPKDQEPQATSMLLCPFVGTRHPSPRLQNQQGAWLRLTKGWLEIGRVPRL